jgi:hypothetical protein
MALSRFTKMDKLEMENIMSVIEELAELNEAMYEIFYGRYFYKMITHIRSPKWVTITNEQLDLINRTYRQRYGKSRYEQPSDTKRYHYSMTISENRHAISKNFEDANMSFGIA